eukprot:TRINITY_DN239_c4_g2_i1.p1 TRINITY_DN239_c4_g2~~TRINITY_DN239_c4_g2_i1.p1  ORF type:complete len:202 (-),score=102.75 TRINITY_DN239_c4_g2_i1:163-768(-)
MATEKDARFKLILLGNIEVGKTCLIIKFTEGVFPEEVTVEIDTKQKDVEVQGKSVKLAITDTAGQERFRTLTSSYFRNADAVIIVYDITEQESFDDVESHINESTRYSNRSEKFLVGNKCDLDDRKIPTETAKALATKNNMAFFETSAKTGHNVNELFKAIAEKLMSKPSADKPPVQIEDSITLTSEPKPTNAKKSGGCNI